MLQIKSFNVKEDEKINEFLKTHIRPEGADVLIAGDYLAISYEDGTGPSITQKILFKQQMQTKEEYKLRDYYHTKRIAEVTIDGVQKEIDKNKAVISEIEAKRKTLDKKINQKEYTDLGLEIKALEKELGHFKIIIANQEGIIKGQQAEITKSMILLAVFQEEISILENESNEEDN